MERLVCIFFFSADDCKNFKVNSSAIDRYFLSLQKIGCAWVLYAFFCVQYLYCLFGFDCSHYCFCTRA